MSKEANVELALREELAEQYRHIVSIGLTELASGNISARLGDEMLISPTGASSATISAESMVRMNLAGEWQGDLQPSSEWPMHAAIYAAYPETTAVVHTHSDHCVALACHNKPLPGFHYLVGVFGGNDVPCVPYYTFGTAELGEAACAALATRSACLLANHGMICRGKNITSAVATAHRLEIMCRQYLLARQFGEPDLLSAQDWLDFFQREKQLGAGTYI